MEMKRSESGLCRMKRLFGLFYPQAMCQSNLCVIHRSHTSCVSDEKHEALHLYVNFLLGICLAVGEGEVNNRNLFAGVWCV